MVVVSGERMEPFGLERRENGFGGVRKILLYSVPPCHTVDLWASCRTKTYVLYLRDIRLLLDQVSIDYSA